jgi:photosystem II stability/assembly factor-like uncharacterized protein
MTGRSLPNGWQWLQPSVTGAHLNAIAFVDSLVGVAAGRDGTILRTADGGLTWLAIPSGTNSALRAVATNGMTVVVVGDESAILRSVDGGLNFSTVETGGTSSFVAVQLLDAKNGVLVSEDGAVFASTDGFQSVSRRGTLPQGTVRGLWFDSPQHGWVVGVKSISVGFIALTSGGGVTFTEQKPVLGKFMELNAIGGLSWPNGPSVLAAGNGPEALSPGGLFWDFGSTIGRSIVGLSVSALQSGEEAHWLVGEDGLWTVHGSSGMAQHPWSSPDIALSAVASPAVATAVAVGEGGTIVRSSFGPPATATVVLGNRLEAFALSSFSSMDGNVGFIVDEQPPGARLWLTQDGGRTLTVAGGVPFANAARTISGVSMVDDQHAFVMLQDGHLYTTSNGGVSFSAVGHVNARGSRIAFASAKQGFASGPFIQTVDGGASWTGAVIGPLPEIVDIAVVDATTAAAVTADGTIYLQDGLNAGVPVWSPFPATANGTLASVAIAANSVLYTGGITRTGAGILCQLPLPSGKLTCSLRPSPVLSIAVSGKRAFALYSDQTIEEIDAIQPTAAAPTGGDFVQLGSRTLNGNGGPVALGSHGELLRFDAARVSNRPPVVTTVQSQVTLPFGARIELDAKAFDPDGQAVTLSWSDPNGASLFFDLPGSPVTHAGWSVRPAPGTTAVARITACDPLGACASADVTVIAPLVASNLPPALTTNGPVLRARQGSQVTLTATAKDPEHETTTIVWSDLQPAAALDFMGNAASNATFTAPNMDMTLMFQATACDPEANCSAATVTVVVGAEHELVADAGTARIVHAGDAVKLNGTASQGAIVSYQWVQLDGPPVMLTGTDQVIAAFVAPSAPARLTFLLTVEDSQGQTATSSVHLSVATASMGPVANAGPEQVGASGGTLVLDGSGSTDPAGGALTAQWQQREGPAASFENDQLLTTRIALPVVATKTKLLIGLGVCDASNECGSAVTTITVVPAGAPALHLSLSIQGHPDGVVPAQGAFVVVEQSFCPTMNCGDAVIKQITGPTLGRSDVTMPDFVAPPVIERQAFSIEGELCDASSTCTTTTLDGFVDPPPTRLVAAPRAGCSSTGVGLLGALIAASTLVQRRRRA